jgi:2-oxoisovalerate dehydrogenase E1 component beta subunit
MTALLNLVQSVNQTLRDEMRRNNDMVILGEDVGRDGGVFRATEGLLEEFGGERVIDTPLSEDGIVGMAIGMALYGLRPVAEIQFLDFIYPAFNQIVSELAKFRYRSGGQFATSLVIRTPYGGGVKGGHYHSQSTEAYFIHTPGLVVVTPSNPYDAKGLLIASLRSPDPVIFLEPKRLYRTIKGEVPDGEYTVPIGRANVIQEGDDVSLVSWGPMVHTCREVVPLAAKEDVSVELIDMRSLLPFDVGTVLDSVRKTGRLVVAHEATKIAGFGAEIAAQVSERAIDSLRSPIIRVAGFDTPFPFALEPYYLPSPERILRGIRRAMGY